MEALTTRPQRGAPLQDPRDDLAKLGVTAQDSTDPTVGATWNYYELRSLVDSYSKAFDQKPLNGLRVIRESTFPPDPYSQAGTHASGADCPTDQQPADKPHTHFYDPAFADNQNDPWKVAGKVRVPVHELGHLVIEEQTPDPSDQKDFDLATTRIQQYKISDFAQPVASVVLDFVWLKPAIIDFQEFGDGTDLDEIVKERAGKLSKARHLAAALESKILQFSALTKSKQGTIPPDATDAASAFLHEARALLQILYSFAEGWRIVDYFIALAQKYAFKPFSINADIDAVEWFAETYALVCIEPQSTKLQPAMATWFTSGFPHCPTKLNDLVLQD